MIVSGSGAEPTNSAITESVIWFLGKKGCVLGGGFNWLTVSSVRFWY